MEVTVREQAMRAIAMIQPPEAGQAFASGLKDADSEIRKMASAGWMKAANIPQEVIPAMVEALRDPEVQVRANAAHALARLDVLATGSEVTQAMEQLVEDANLRSASPSQFSPNPHKRMALISFLILKSGSLKGCSKLANINFGM